ncbi:hypothetical protein Mgra_00009428 [Meloidogyne graminicola]|uniref:Uncharacterized protein n=1 Tax=Meloidogyne graminicola TaxID=189291 RepID=A0A8S9Z9X9_9BILA|nr:hypothetical protein Mgra_00009428 [Meloidogyne graminicola]
MICVYPIPDLSENNKLFIIMAYLNDICSNETPSPNTKNLINKFSIYLNTYILIYNIHKFNNKPIYY